MKKILFGVWLLLFTVNSYSQINFEKGYFIDNENRKVECYIKNVDWEVNPLSFAFKLSEDGEVQQATLEKVKEFGIFNRAKYMRVSCDIDRSKQDVSKLSRGRLPEFKRELLFLKVLVEGKASLYSYSTSDLKRFFFKVDSTAIEQLVYKVYLVKESSIGKNFTFRQQLLNALQCDGVSRHRIENLSYSQNDLRKLFVDYNTCMGVESENAGKKEKRNVFNLWLRPRLALSSFSAKRKNEFNTLNFKFDNQIKFSAGIEAEIILPFNNDKWAITIEPTYQTYSASISSERITVDYTAIEVPIGLRHYFFIGKNSKISLSAAFQFSPSKNSTLVHLSSLTLDLSSSTNFVFEAGYIFLNRFCVAYRYQTPREMLADYQIWNSDFRSMAVIFGYSLF